MLVRAKFLKTYWIHFADALYINYFTNPQNNPGQISTFTIPVSQRDITIIPKLHEQ